MKKIFFVVSLLVLFFSCSNIDLTSNPDLISDSGSNSDSKLYSISITLDHERIGGVPFNTNFTDNNSSRSAYGNTDPALLKTVIYYKNHEDNSSFTKLSETDESTFTIQLKAGNWDLKAESYIKQGENINPIYVSDVTRLILNDDTISQYVVLTLNVNTTMTRTGTVKLPVKKTADSVNKCVITWNKRGSSFQSGDTQTLTLSSSIAYFTMNSSSSSPVSSGVYEVNFNFQNSSGSTLYRCSELVVVYDDLCTDTWEDSGNSEYFISQQINGKDCLVLCVGDDCISSQVVGDIVYVNPDAADGGNGSFFGEFKTLKAAVDAVNAGSTIKTICLHENKEYTIDSTITFNKNVDLKTYNKSASSNSSNATLKRSTDFTGGSMFIVSINKTVTFDGHFVIDGNNVTTSVNGAGINNNGSLTLKNTEIKKCKTSGMGAGIYNKGTLTFDTGAKVTGCDVYLYGSKYIKVASKNIGVITITPNDYARSDALLIGKINNIDVTLDSNYLDYIAKFDVTAKTAGSVTTKYYLDTNAKLIAETIPVSVLAEKISGVPSSTDYPKLQAGSASDITKIATWSGNTNFSGQTIQLKENISMSGQTGFTGIGSSAKPFKGTFDGNSKTVSNLTRPLFNYTGDGSTVKSVTVSGDYSTYAVNNSLLGGLVTEMTGGTIDSCISSIAVDYSTKTESSSYGRTVVGGIAGKVTRGVIKNCTNKGDITSNTDSGNSTGGIIGEIDSSNYSVTINECSNEAFISGSGSSGASNNGTGGIAGYANGTNSIVIENSKNIKQIKGDGNVGGILGHSRSSNILIKNCFNNANELEINALGANCGGIVGYNSEGCEINSCYNSSPVKGESSVGGISGYNYSGVIKNCFNTGNVTSNNFSAGGISGYWRISSTNGIYNCYNSANVKSNAPDYGYVGGIVGQTACDTSSSLNIINCLNTGNISTDATAKKVGGIVGNLSSSAIIGDNLNNLFISDDSNSKGAVGNYTDFTASNFYDSNSPTGIDEESPYKYYISFIPFNSNSIKYSFNVKTTYYSSGTGTKNVMDLLNAWVNLKNGSSNPKLYKQWNYSGGTYSFKSE